MPDGPDADTCGEGTAVELGLSLPGREGVVRLAATVRQRDRNQSGMALGLAFDDGSDGGTVREYLRDVTID